MITEERIHNIVGLSINHVINESTNGNLKKKYIHRIYKLLHSEGIVTNRRYHDDYWQGKDDVCDILHEALGDGADISVYPVNGGYRTSRDGMSHWKEYQIEITTEDGINIGGTLNCNAAGSVEDPFDAYDVTVVLW